MARYTKQSVTSLAGINSELTKIQTALADTLSRKDDTPNQMEGTFDANSNRIINLPDPVADHEPVTVGSVQQFVDRATGANIVSETQPTTGLRQGLRWYKPSDATTYVYYIDEDGAQWVEEPVQSAEGTLRTELSTETSTVVIAAKQAQQIVEDQKFTGTNNVGDVISGVKNQVQFLTDKTDRSLKSGVYLTPDIGHRVGRLAYRKVNGKAELITNIDRFKPYWFYMSPEAAQEHGLNVYYVSKAGNDANDGLSWATALRTITAAFNKNSSDADYIAVRAGHYGLTDGFAKRTITKNLVMKAIGGDVIISNQRLVTWTDNGNGTHTSNALGGTPLPVVSPLYVDEFGDFIRFTLVGTLAEVATTPYSRFVSGSGTSQTVTINLNGVTPTDNNVYVPRAQDLGFGFNNAALKLHIEGFQFIMGQNAACRVNSGTINSVFSAKDCWFRNSFNTDDLEVLDVGTVILDNCRASAGDKDGFNYHEGVNTVPVHVVEINCIGINHRRTEGTANGSTLHEACKAIRIGGTYGWGWGPGVADINDSQAVNVGCVSNGGRLYTNAKGFQNEGNSIGYYDGCVSGGNTSVSDPNLAALSVENSGAIAYVSTDNNFDIIETSGGGQVLTYVPDGSL